MAINPESQYPGKIAPSSPDYPYGQARNITTPGDGTGTPWDAALVNDVFGFQQAILSAASIVPSGTPETAQASQYLDALFTLVTGRAPLAFANVANMQARTPLNGPAVTFKAGDVASVAGSYYVVVSAQVTGDITITGQPTLWLRNVAGVRKITDNGADKTAVNNTAAISQTLAENQEAGGEVFIPEGTFATDNNILPDNAAAANKHHFKGAKRQKSLITTTHGGVLVYIREGFDFSDLGISQTGTAGTGRALATNDSKQTALGTMQGVDISNFRYGVWKRYSLWDSYRDLRLVNNKCGIRLARNAYQAGNTNPNAPGGWNLDPGWFHNVLAFDNVYCEGGEVGIWSASMCATYNAVTCQGQGTDGTANDVLPGTQQGTGLFLEAGTDGTLGWNNQIISYYAEFSQIGMYLKDQRYVGVDGAFVQGGSSGDRAQSAVIADNSVVELNGLVGQDWFDDVYEAKNGGTLYVNHEGGPLSGNKYLTDATSKIKKRGTVDKDKFEYSITRPLAGGTQTFTLPVTVPEASVAMLHIIGLYDGFSVRYGSAVLHNWNAAVTTAIEWLTGAGSPPSETTVNVSNSGTIDIVISGTQAYTARVVLEIIGGDVSGNPIAITGV